MKKKRILFHSNFSKASSGFGRNAKNVLVELYKSGEYEILELANLTQEGSLQSKTLPWTVIGTMPKGNFAQKYYPDFEKIRNITYGHESIDKVIEDFRPDVYIGVEDVWAFNGFEERSWWNKIHKIIWTTVDSEPVTERAFEMAKLSDDFLVWSGFAEKYMKEKGEQNVATLNGSLDHKEFYPLSELEISKFKKRNNLEDEFLIGFVFKNQLRKSSFSLIEGYKRFKKKNPKAKAKVVLHTEWGDDTSGWPILKILKEKGVSKEDVLATFQCKNCGAAHILPYEENHNCNICNSENSLKQKSLSEGFSTSNLNLIYNSFDVYVHPFTSGGQELPIQEAKLCEKITMVTDYSCGSDFSKREIGSIPLNWTEYMEPSSNFSKAATCPNSIAKNLEKVFKMSPEARLKLGKIGRQFAIDTLSPSVICETLKKLINKAEYLSDQIDLRTVNKEEKFNVSFVPDETLDDSEWVLSIYENILGRKTINKEDDGFKHWMARLSDGEPRENILNYFKSVAQEEIDGKKTIELKEMLDKDDEGKRLLFVMPKSIGDIFLSTALLGNLKKAYEDYNIYFACEPKYFSLLKYNPHIFKMIPYSSFMDNPLTMEGRGQNKGLFEICLTPYTLTQRNQTKNHNGKDRNDILSQSSSTYNVRKAKTVQVGEKHREADSETGLPELGCSDVQRFVPKLLRGDIR